MLYFSYTQGGFAKTLFHVGVGSTIALFFAVVLLMTLKLQTIRETEDLEPKAPEDIYETTVLSSLDTLLPNEVLRHDFPFWPVNLGYIPVSTILSEDKKHLLFTEISDCILAEDEACDPVLHIVEQNSTTGDSMLVYNGGKTADGFFPFPVGYFPEEHKLLVHRTMLENGELPPEEHLYATLDTRTGVIENFATDLDYLFGDSRYLYTEFSKESSYSCHTRGFEPNKIVSRNAPNGNPSTVLEEPDMNYTLIAIHEENLYFLATPLTVNEEGCSTNANEPTLRSLPLISTR